jgi:hypothetical protein
MKVTKLSLIAAGVIGLGAFAGQAQAAHPGGDVPMLDKNGNALVAPSTTGYSPKQTCSSTPQNGLLSCHNYESDIANAAKSQFRRDGTEATYEVPYPQHGVSAGYHFQQGRSLDHGDTQRAFYGLPGFTSSLGMYGKL